MGVDQSQPNSRGRSFDTRMDMELGQNALNMGPDCVGTEYEAFGHLAAVCALGQQHQDLVLPRRQEFHR